MEKETFKQLLLDYLEKLETLTDQDIKDHKNLPPQDKIEEGLLIQGAKAVGISQVKDDLEITFQTPINETKWRAGDKLNCTEISSPQKGEECTVLENNRTDIIVRVAKNSKIKLNQKYNLEQLEQNFTELVIGALKKSDGDFLSDLSAEQPPLTFGAGGSLFSPTNPINTYNAKQKGAINAILKQPSLYAIQGPPGTGKTKVLSFIADEFSKNGYTVLVISKAHDAVNNALNSIKKITQQPVIKVGSEFQKEGLDKGITTLENKDLKIKRGDIVGFSLLSALKTKKIPTDHIVILVDEASQILLAEAAALDRITASTIVFFGDDRQMPPIFHGKLKNDSLSISIFEYLKMLLPKNLQTVLTTTYRMNHMVCRYVSKHFYQPYGITLKSDKSICCQALAGESMRGSIELVPVTPGHPCQEVNADEAQAVACRAFKYHQKGETVAIITPFRKQVNAIRCEWKKLCSSDILIDTVERLQGQEADAILISMAISDPNYYNAVKDFIENSNRLNVMVSRAKKKVVVFASPIAIQIFQ